MTRAAATRLLAVAVSALFVCRLGHKVSEQFSIRSADVGGGGPNGVLIAGAAGAPGRLFCSLAGLRGYFALVVVNTDAYTAADVAAAAALLQHERTRFTDELKNVIYGHGAEEGAFGVGAKLELGAVPHMQSKRGTMRGRQLGPTERFIPNRAVGALFHRGSLHFPVAVQVHHGVREAVVLLPEQARAADERNLDCVRHAQDDASACRTIIVDLNQMKTARQQETT